MLYTYAHYKPEGGLFYIGKGTKKRAFQMDGRNKYWQNIVNKYGRPHVELLARWDTEQEAFSHEKLLISCFKDMGFKLVNLTDGGEGTSGYKLSDDTKKVISKNVAKLWQNPEYRLHMSVVKIGKPSNAKGLKHSPETIERMRQSKIGKPSGKKGMKMSQEHNDRMKELAKAQAWTCPHCNTSGLSKGAGNRWHFDNCKGAR